jgi:acetyl-CoA decarbonylase/synthase complex subunit beta
MASDLKERVGDAIPEEMKDLIATEDNAKDIEELSEFLKSVNHPVVNGVTREVDGTKITEGWTKKEEEVAPTAVVAAAAPVGEGLAQVPMTQVMGSEAPLKLIFKDANISIGKLIIKRKGEK